MLDYYAEQDQLHNKREQCVCGCRTFGWALQMNRESDGKWYHPYHQRLAVVSRRSQQEASVICPAANEIIPAFAFAEIQGAAA